MIVYVENPTQKGPFSNVLTNPVEEQIESDFNPFFEQCQDLEQVKAQLTHMENNGLHIRNGRGMVFRSYCMVQVIEAIEQLNAHLMFNQLSRTANLRAVVYYFITGKINERMVEVE